MSTVSGREVIQFFKNADLELAELVLEFGNTAVEARVEARAKISANMKKARAARKPAAVAGEAAAPETQVPAQEAAPVAHRGRPARVPAPAHTAQATSVESDNEQAVSA